MRNYLIRRLLLFIPTVFIVSLIVFILVRSVPGTVLDIMVADYGTLGTVTPMDREAIRHALGMDVPIVIQYGHWITSVVHGDLGKSLWKQVPVVEDIKVRWPVTFELGLLAIVIGQVIALPIGIYSALRQDTWGDYLARSFAILLIAVPSFWIATLVIVYPAIWWNYMPPLALIQFTDDPLGNLKMFIVPAVILGMGMSGGTMRMTRTMMLEVMRQDYIRTAWAKGLKERVVVIRHALRNALIPIVTIIGQQAPVLVGGTVIIESIFNLPGMGRLTTDAIATRDYTVVSACLLIFSIALVTINLITDITYGYLDPRIHYN